MGGVFVIITMVSARFLTKSPENVAIALQRSISNEIEMGHGRVSWKTRGAYFAKGPLASSIA
jgi:hypothetical protein